MFRELEERKLLREPLGNGALTSHDVVRAHLVELTLGIPKTMRIRGGPKHLLNLALWYDDWIGGRAGSGG